ncbi:unnamed protein product [Auanema sp. JU1783]|nr:unnamed protein product [Auanema sp. JU1783]
MKGNEVVNDVLEKLQEINNNLMEAIKTTESEFSTATVDLPSFDNVDMELLLGKDECPQSESMLTKVANSMKAQKERVAQLLAEADIMLLEYDHIKKGTIA